MENQAVAENIFATRLKTLENPSQILSNPEYAEEIREKIIQGEVFIAKQVCSPEWVQQVKTYLTRVGNSSLPNYKPIEMGCPNFHRMNRWDPRSYVKACFHQFVFFPWNQDMFNFFDVARETYQIKNVLSHNPKDKFLGQTPEEDCVSRIAFQFYPKSVGGLNKHIDPVDHHQLCVPIMIMSKKGVDFETGGVYAETANGEKIYLDAEADPGDVVYFNARIPHGVEIIDEHKKEDWLSFEGRWMMLFAINKLSTNNAIANALDLGNG